MDALIFLLFIGLIVWFIIYVIVRGPHYRRKQEMITAATGFDRMLTFNARLLGIDPTPEGTLKIKGQGEIPVVGTTVRVENVGEIRQRITATRMLAWGVFSITAPKKYDERQTFITFDNRALDRVAFIEVKGNGKNRSTAERIATIINNQGSEVTGA